MKLTEPMHKKNHINIHFYTKKEFNYNGYENELIQVLIILFNNAKDALVKDTNNPKKTILVCIKKFNEYLIIEIGDNAQGIDKEQIHKLFDPYFTTSQKTQGKGLGLYIAKMIIEESFKGKITAENQKKGGRIMAAKKKTKEIEKMLKRSPKPVWDVLTQKERETALGFSEGYKKFLDAARTEREAVREIVAMAKAEGFKESPAKNPKKYLKINREKSVALAVMGKKPLTEGFRIVISHIDAPRLDLKQNPLYEDVDLALLRTHYYGGIKKYQWVAIPLAIHGTIIKKDGTKLDLVLGEQE